jgi:hypothetical protein
MRWPVLRLLYQPRKIEDYECLEVGGNWQGKP